MTKKEKRWHALGDRLAGENIAAVEALKAHYAAKPDIDHPERAAWSREADRLSAAHDAASERWGRWSDEDRRRRGWAPLEDTP